MTYISTDASSFIKLDICGYATYGRPDWGLEDFLLHNSNMHYHKEFDRSQRGMDPTEDVHL